MKGTVKMMPAAIGYEMLIKKERKEVEPNKRAGLLALFRKTKRCSLHEILTGLKQGLKLIMGKDMLNKQRKSCQSQVFFS